ncbi:unnamed protein product, partial [Rotaria sp. Silwood1]
MIVDGSIEFYTTDPQYCNHYVPFEVYLKSYGCVD